MSFPTRNFRMYNNGNPLKCINWWGYWNEIKFKLIKESHEEKKNLHSTLKSISFTYFLGSTRSTKCFRNKAKRKKIYDDKIARKLLRTKRRTIYVPHPWFHAFILLFAVYISGNVEFIQFKCILHLYNSTHKTDPHWNVEYSMPYT